MTAKNAFDTSGPSIWEKELAKLKLSQGAQRSGQRRREELRKSEVMGDFLLTSKQYAKTKN